MRITAAADPRLVPLAGVGQGAAPWLRREFFPAGTLEDRMVRGPDLEIGEIVTAASAVVGALEFLTHLGLGHGDPSPHNVVLTDAGEARLADAVSCRRRFLEEDSPPGWEREMDIRRFLAWLRRALLGTVSDMTDPLPSRLLAELDAPESPAEVYAGVARLLSEAHGRAVAMRPAADRSRPGGPPTAIRVLLAIETIRDERACYLAAKRLSAGGAGPAANLRKQLSEGDSAVEVSFPEPARSLAAQLRGEGVRVAVRAKPELPPVQDPDPVPPPPRVAAPAREAPPATEKSSSPAPTNPLPSLDLIPLRGLPASARRLRTLLRALYGGVAPEQVGEVAGQAVLAGAVVAAHLVLAHALVLFLVNFATLVGTGRH